MNRFGKSTALILFSITALAGSGFGDDKIDLVQVCSEAIERNNRCKNLEKFTDGCRHVVENQNRASKMCFEAAFNVYDCMRKSSCSDMWEQEKSSSCWSEYSNYTRHCDGELIKSRESLDRSDPAPTLARRLERRPL